MINFPITDKIVEEALRYVAEKMPNASTLPKPTLLHSIRVGVYLYNNYYPSDVCIAGLLYDLLEDSDVTVEEITKKFGKAVAVLVSANTKDEMLKDDKIYPELIQRCVDTSEYAAIVKAADIIDNLISYRRINDDEGIRNMLKFGTILLKIKPASYTDRIFDELKKLIKK